MGWAPWSDGTTAPAYTDLSSLDIIFWDTHAVETSNNQPSRTRDETFSLYGSPGFEYDYVANVNALKSWLDGGDRTLVPSSVQQPEPADIAEGAFGVQCYPRNSRPLQATGASNAVGTGHPLTVGVPFLQFHPANTARGQPTTIDPMALRRARRSGRWICLLYPASKPCLSLSCTTSGTVHELSSGPFTCTAATLRSGADSWLA